MGCKLRRVPDGSRYKLALEKGLGKLWPFKSRPGLKSTYEIELEEGRHGHKFRRVSDGSRYKLALEEGRRTLEQQAEALARIRDRVGSLVGVGALAAAFIGGLSQTPDTQLSWAAWAGVLAFLSLLGIAVKTIPPINVNFAQHAKVLVETAEKEDADLIARALALQMDEWCNANKGVLQNLLWWYFVGVGVVIIEVVLLLIDLRFR